jgi:hypothetical protein
MVIPDQVFGPLAACRYGRYFAVGAMAAASHAEL